MKRMILLVMMLMMFVTAGCSADQASSSLEEGMRYLEQGEYGKAAEAFPRFRPLRGTSDTAAARPRPR